MVPPLRHATAPDSATLVGTVIRAAGRIDPLWRGARHSDGEADSAASSIIAGRTPAHEREGRTMSAPTVDRPLPPSDPVPPLRHGDRLTREEFERRYHAMPHV